MTNDVIYFILDCGVTGSISLEPCVYLPDRFGIRVEDIVAVTSDGCEYFTHFWHEMVVNV